MSTSIFSVIFIGVLLSIYSQSSLAQSQWYKGNTHAHTTNSDGTMSPSFVADTYKKLGYDFLFITDHNDLTSVEIFSTSDFLCISGEEVTFARHINGLNLKRKVFPGTTNTVIDSINSQGATSTLCHPYWPPTRIFASEILKLNKLNFIEIHNALTESLGFFDNQLLWDSLLTSHKLIYGIASDDSHKIENIGKAWIMVNAGALQTDSIMSALKRGKFYSTTGINISNLNIIDSTIYISTNNGNKIEFIGIYGRVLKTEYNNYASYRIKGTEGYIRIVLSNNKAQKAWTQPIVWKNTLNPPGFLNDSTRINNLALKIYPNPSSGFVNVSYKGENDEPMYYYITNTQGHIFRDGLIYENQRSILDFSSFPKGLYFLLFYNKSSNQVCKIILQ